MIHKESDACTSYEKYICNVLVMRTINKLMNVHAKSHASIVIHENYIEVIRLGGHPKQTRKATTDTYFERCTYNVLAIRHFHALVACHFWYKKLHKSDAAKGTS